MKSEKGTNTKGRCETKISKKGKLSQSSQCKTLDTKDIPYERYSLLQLRKIFPTKLCPNISNRNKYTQADTSSNIIPRMIVTDKSEEYTKKMTDEKLEAAIPMNPQSEKEYEPRNNPKKYVMDNGIRPGKATVVVGFVHDPTEDAGPSSLPFGSGATSTPGRSPCSTSVKAEANTKDYASKIDLPELRMIDFRSFYLQPPQLRSVMIKYVIPIRGIKDSAKR